MIMKKMYTLCFVVISLFISAQNGKLDSLLSVYKTTKIAENKQEAALYLSKELFYQNKDSALMFLNYAKQGVKKHKSNKKLISLYYYIQAYFTSDDVGHERAIMYCDSCISIANTADLELQKADCYFSKAVSSYNLGQKKEAIKYFKLSTPIFKKEGKRKKAVNGYANLIAIYQDYNSSDTCEMFFKEAINIADTVEDCKILARLYSNMSALYDKSHRFQTSITYLIIALKYAESCDANKVTILSNLGQEYININNYEKAERYIKLGYLKAYESERADYILDLAADYALFYQNRNKFKESKVILDSAIKYIDTVDYMESSAKLSRSLSWTYAELGEFQKAIYYGDLNIRLCKQNEDDNGLAEAYEYRGYVFYKQKNYNAAIKMYLDGLDLATKIENMVYIKNFYQSLYRAYDESGDYKNGMRYAKLYIELNDSITNYDNSTINSELETKYNSEKKESEIKLLNEEAKYSELELSKSKQQKMILLIGLLVSAFVLSFVIYSYVQKRRANILISLQKEELQAQKLLVESQKELVEEHQKEIVDSIQYAKRIQYTLLAHQDFVDENLPNNFILFRPKDIVSGDFYWATKNGSKFYFAVCDSTGHGVPGAFMSLLNIGFLSEAINEKKIVEPNKVFDYVRNRLITSISKEGQQDGFDGILICVDCITKKISYAAANNAPILISDGNIMELDKDRMPVGKGEREQLFTEFSIVYKEGDILYLYTDGYADQFGGPKGKKFKYKQLNDLLLKNSNLSLNEQSDVLVNEFTQWKGNLEQVDDICIIGIKL